MSSIRPSTSSFDRPAGAEYIRATGRRDKREGREGEGRGEERAAKERRTATILFDATIVARDRSAIFDAGRMCRSIVIDSAIILVVVVN